MTKASAFRKVTTMIRNTLLFFLCPIAFTSVYAEIENEINLGIEAVTGIRSGYLHRGYDLADASLEFQLHAEFALSNESSLNFGVWHLAESDGDFSANSAYLELDHQVAEQLWIGGSITYRKLDRSTLDSGGDLGTYFRYRPHDDWTISGELHYDFAADGWYADTELEWSQPLSDSAFIAIINGVSFASEYYGDSSFHDVFSKITLTYALSDEIAFTPFVGSNFPLSDSNRDDEFYAGLWFEVIF